MMVIYYNIFSNHKISLQSVPAISTTQAIADLPPPNGMQGIPNHDYVPVNASKQLAINRLATGHSLIKYPGSHGRVMSTWTRLPPNTPSLTILGKSRYIHPFEDRLLTIREHARLMSYPDDFVFIGDRREQFDQVGESVPPRIAELIAERIMENILH